MLLMFDVGMMYGFRDGVLDGLDVCCMILCVEIYGGCVCLIVCYEFFLI